ncbi:MAG: NAD(P)/FAD-dependent oxidoreductase [Candidatus Omnitrophica bacterium]|nr:NAD(P)/FAD-dependent oxidoreductase [Candidatus Omnitrophota bacterium]
MIYDVAIVGAGAAGLMTAIRAAQGGLRVLLLEGQQKPGAKILMSGGNRCNVTNRSVSEKDFNSEKIIYVRHILKSFGNTDTIKFFKDLGVELIPEFTGKYFPSTNSGKTILNALLNKVESEGVTLLCDYKVKALASHINGFQVKGDQFHFEAKNIVLTTGGLSYPSTGSDGMGYRLAQSFGHSMVETVPALTPLTTDDKDLKSLSGITLEAQLTLLVDGKKHFSCRGSFLFTHFGYSGPAALNISRHWTKAQGPKQIIANFIVDHDEASLQKYLSELQQKSARRSLMNVLTELMPQRLADIIFRKTRIDSSMTMNQLSRESRQILIKRCVQYPLDVTGVLGFSKAEVTAGGIDLAEINPKTLESRLVSGLFFAGEILDVDGRIGGYNFQWAWASGNAVAQALIKKQRSQYEQKDHQNG